MLTCGKCGGTEDVQLVRVARNVAQPWKFIDEPVPVGSSCDCSALKDDPCPTCGGDWFVRPDPDCDVCDGKGVVEREGVTRAVMDAGPIPSASSGPPIEAWCGKCRAENERRMREEYEL